MIDMKDCFDHFEKLDRNEKNMNHKIMHSEEVNDWIQQDESSILVIDLQTPPASLNNSLLFTSVLLVTLAIHFRVKLAFSSHGAK
jgi:hypothetical protein